jgi:NADP-dependent 3-hydroxy acid dehydrogenase YdfG
MNVDHAVSIVTGATGGIGRAIGVALAERQGRVVAVGRRTDALEESAATIAAHGGDAATVSGDVSDADTARRAVDLARSRFGRVDVLVNAAGFGPPMPLLDLTRDVWDATIDSCLTGVYAMTRAVLPLMVDAGAGRIVNVSSIAGKGAEANRTAYCAAKWGLEGFSLALRAELVGTGVRVHVLNPASVATTWWEATGDPQPPDVLAAMLHPDDVARAALSVLTQPAHVRIDDVVIHNADNPWRSP